MTTNNDPNTYNDGTTWHHGGKAGVTGSLDASGNSTVPRLNVEMGGGVEVRVGRHGAQTVSDDSASGGSGHQVHPERVPNGATGLLATARTSWGSVAQPSNLKPTDRLTYQGMEIEVAVAEKLGLVTRNPNTGLYQETGAQAPTDAPPAEPRFDGGDEGQDSRELFANPKAEDFVGMLPMEGQTAIATDLIENGQVTEGSIHKLAQALGVEPEAAQRYAAVAVEQFASQASEKLAQFGIDDGEGFARWAMSARAAEWKEAVRRHYIERTTEGYRGLALDYLNHLHSTDPALIAGSNFGPGVTARLVGKTVMIRSPHLGELSFPAALRAGLIGPQR
jgi:hypothetical protein